VNDPDQKEKLLKFYYFRLYFLNNLSIVLTGWNRVLLYLNHFKATEKLHPSLLTTINNNCDKLSRVLTSICRTTQIPITHVQKNKKLHSQILA
jgi:hypothetical protein